MSMITIGALQDKIATLTAERDALAARVAELEDDLSAWQSAAGAK